MQPLLRSIGPRSASYSTARTAGVLRQLHIPGTKHPTAGWDEYDVRDIATLLENARARNYQVPPLSKYASNLDQRRGYQIAAAIRELRERTNGEIVGGRKIGFTNRGIWPEYGIDASNWSYMYQNTIVNIAEQGTSESQDQPVEVDLSHLSNLQPRIEPEIVLGLAATPSPSMSDEEVLGCIDWIAHGFEIVASVYPDWKFTAADTTAAFALHGLLVVGRQVPVRTLTESSTIPLLGQLSTFNISLFKNNELADEGKGSNVLGSPIKALRHLIELLEQDEFNMPLSSGEIVTTGTLTRALPIGHGDIWSTQLTGIDLPGLQLKFRLR